MNTTPDLTDMAQMLLASLAGQFPTMLISLVACVIIFLRRSQLGKAAGWGFAGFGLLLVISAFVPVSQVLVHQWIVQGEPSRSMLISLLSILWPSLRAIAYGLLLMALLAGRPATPTIPAQS